MPSCVFCHWSTGLSDGMHILSCAFQSGPLGWRQGRSSSNVSTDVSSMVGIFPLVFFTRWVIQYLGMLEKNRGLCCVIEGSTQFLCLRRVQRRLQICMLSLVNRSLGRYAYFILRFPERPFGLEARKIFLQCIYWCVQHGWNLPISVFYKVSHPIPWNVGKKSRAMLCYWGFHSIFVS